MSKKKVKVNEASIVKRAERLTIDREELTRVEARVLAMLISYSDEQGNVTLSNDNGTLSTYKINLPTTRSQS